MAATMLADFGARVIKIEPPDSGDGYRQLQNMPGLPKGDVNYPWRLTSRSKESLALDLKNPESRQALNALATRADVFITNYPLPVRETLNITAADIRAMNPRIIYASMWEHGRTPWFIKSGGTAGGIYKTTDGGDTGKSSVEACLN